MKRLAEIAIFAALAASPACAHSAEAKHAAAGPQIVGPERAEPGDLVVLRLQDAGQSKTAWQAFGPTAAVTGWVALEQGRVVVFASRQAGVYHFACALWDGQQVHMLVHRLENGGSGPAPVPPGPSPPNPNPPGPSPPGPNPPEPTPPGPETAWRDWARQKATELVQSPQRAAEAKAAAKALRAVAADLRAGKFSSLRAAREALRTATRAALADAVGRWSAFSDAVDWQMDRLAEKGQLATAEQYAGVWTAIAEGLEEVQ